MRPLAVLALAVPALAFAQGFPSKPVHIVAPVVAGSAPDIRLRQIVPGLAASLGQLVIIDNRPGANGAIGAREAAKAPPDGHTLFNANINNVLNDLLAPDPSCRLNRELVAVTDIAGSPLIMVVNPSVPAKTLAEFVALAKAKPKALTYASGGTGGVIQLLGERIKAAAGIDVTEIPYKSLGADLPNLLAGHVSAGFSVYSTLGAHIQGGRLRALAVASAARLPVLPQVPTLAEAGLPGMEATVWNGIFAPAGTPPPVLRLLQRELARALDQPDVRAQIAESGAYSGGKSPEQFAAFVDAESAQWSKVIREAGIRLQ